MLVGPQPILHLHMPSECDLISAISQPSEQIVHLLNGKAPQAVTEPILKVASSAFLFGFSKMRPASLIHSAGPAALACSLPAVF